MSISDQMTKILAKLTLLQRNGMLDDMANAIDFLASSDTQFITGVNLFVNERIIYNLPADFSV